MKHFKTQHNDTRYLCWVLFILNIPVKSIMLSVIMIIIKIRLLLRNIRFLWRLWHSAFQHYDTWCLCRVSQLYSLCWVSLSCVLLCWLSWRVKTYSWNLPYIIQPMSNRLERLFQESIYSIVYYFIVSWGVFLMEGTTTRLTVSLSTSIT